MVWDPKQETVDVNRMIIYSFVPILSVYALWRIQKFWLISLISIPISFGMQLLMGVATIPSQNQPIIGILLFLMTLGLYIAVCVLLVRHYAQKYNKKIENVGGVVESKSTVISRGTVMSRDNDENHSEICKDDKCILNKDEVLQHTIRQHTNAKITIIGDSEGSCPNCYHEKTLHISTNVSTFFSGQELVENECLGCKKDGLTVICKEFFETPAAATKENIGEKLEESKRQVEEAEKELEEKKKRKEESRNKMEGEEKLKESKRQVEEAEKELEEKKKRKEESRNKRDIDKQIAINEEKIRKIEEESKKLDEES
jgi:hypothetical protein